VFDGLGLSKPAQYFYLVCLVLAFAIAVYWTITNTGLSQPLIWLQSKIFFGRYFGVLTVFLSALPIALVGQVLAYLLECIFKKQSHIEMFLDRVRPDAAEARSYEDRWRVGRSGRQFDRRFHHVLTLVGPTRSARLSKREPQACRTCVIGSASASGTGRKAATAVTAAPLSARQARRHASRSDPRPARRHACAPRPAAVVRPQSAGDFAPRRTVLTDRARD
jgi:hypothetical protein